MKAILSKTSTFITLGLIFLSFSFSQVDLSNSTNAPNEKSRNISGTVTDADNNPLIGVIIFVDETKKVLEKAERSGIEVIVGNPDKMDASAVFGAIFQYPGTYGHVRNGIAFRVATVGDHRWPDGGVELRQSPKALPTGLSLTR